MSKIPMMHVEILEEDLLRITKKSIFTGKDNTMELPISLERLARWQHGEGLIQNVFPDLDTTQREFLMTGATQEEWDDMFGGEDE